MARNSKPLTLEEVSGNQYPSLDSAWQAARFAIAQELARTIKRLLEAEELEVVNNQIRPKE